MSGRDRLPEPLACCHCGEPIGMYEPMVVVRGGVPVVTSRLALDEEKPERPFHADCFAEIEDA